MSLHTSVAQIRDVPAGTDVSYGRTYTTEKPTRMAVLPIGYAAVSYTHLEQSKPEVVVPPQT